MKQQKFYLSIQILRMLFSFHILVFHCINKRLYKNKIIQYLINDVSIDLIIFFMISFYISYNTFTLRNIAKIRQRFYRLLIPYVIWPNIFVILTNLILYISGKKIYINLFILYCQLLIGNGILLVFWFQFNLIFLSLFFVIIIFLSKKKHLFYLLLIGILSYLFINSIYFNRLFPKTIFLFFSIRLIFSSYIYSFFGFLLFSINIDDKLKKYRQKSLIISFIISILFIYYNYLYRENTYSLIIKVLGCINIFIFFLILPLDKIPNNNLIYIIKLITRFTGGVYYLHIKVQLLLEYFCKNMRAKTIIVCIINYLLCYFICLMGSKLFKKFNLRYLFM